MGFKEKSNCIKDSVYIDDGFTGLNMERPDLKRMLKAIERKQVNLVITKDLSRLGRNYLQTGQLIEDFFPRNGVRYIAMNDGIDTMRDNNDIAPFKNILNEMYSKDISKKVHSSYVLKAQKGQFTGCIAPFGYKKDPEDKNHLLIDGETAPVVRLIFGYALDGHGPNYIRRRLEEEKHPCPTWWNRKRGHRNIRTKYGEFTYEQVKDEVEDIFREQYSLYVDEVNDTVTETKTVRVGESLGQVVTSGYCNCSICCGVWSGGPTASGVYPTANHTIAVDAANPFVPMGTKVVMNGVEYVVEDTGAFARYGVQFDVYYDSHSAASAHGHQTWEAFIADDNGNQEVEVTTTEVINRLEVTLTNHNLDVVLRSRMDENEEKRYDLYNGTYGNRNYLFDVGSLPGGGGADGYGYEIPSEALSDEKFARMIHEAEKYLGRPYVWGGASPSTGFDCSGFVSWVINNCGNGWNVGRQTAEGLRGCCAHVPSSQAKPGDLIFFQNTYPTSGASHVGIYVGNNMMIHCGDPIQYTNISSAYWQQHLLGFGRLP